jgi:hypothetical protein
MTQSRSHEDTERLVYYHELVGLEDNTEADDNIGLEMHRIKACFGEWEKAITKTIEENAIKYVRGGLTEQQFKAILHKYRTVGETRKHIPGLPSKMEDQIALRGIIESILVKIKELQANGKSLKVYKRDYQQIKQRLLKILFGCFGTAEDLGFGDYLEISNFDYAIMKLEEMDMIPKGMKEEIKIYLCPVGRWY